MSGARAAAVRRRRVALADVARSAGVSVTTASIVLNKTSQPDRIGDDTRRRVEQIAAELGYVPNYHAQSMRRGASQTLAVCLNVRHEPNVELAPGEPNNIELAKTYFGHLIGGIETEARNAGYLTTIVGPDGTGDAVDRALLRLRQRQFDAVIVPCVLLNAEATERLAKQVAETRPSAGGPVVVVEPRVSTALPEVRFDDEEAGKLIADHLLKLGHRHLVWVGPENRPGDATERRLAGIRSRCGEAGATMEERYFSLERFFRRSTLIAQPAVACIADWIKEHRDAKGKGPLPKGTTAVIAYNDPVAIGVCQALTAAGISVPNDVSVAGFDNVEGALCTPPLTSVDHRLTHMGELAARLALGRIDDEATEDLGESHLCVAPTLAIRESTGPAPKAD